MKVIIHDLSDEIWNTSLSTAANMAAPAGMRKSCRSESTFLRSAIKKRGISPA